MKILHLIDSGGLYGAERMLLDLAEAQQRAGLAVSILSSTNSAATTKPLVVAARERGLDVIEWCMADGLNLAGARRILAFARRQNYQLLHSHGYKFNILMGLVPRWCRKLPRVCTVHGYLAAPRGTRLWLYQQLDRHLLARADATVFVSRAMLGQPAFRGLAIRNARVIYNGINFDSQRDSADCRAGDPRQQWFPAAGAPVRLIAAVGRLSAEKGYDDLLEAFRTVHQSEPQARLLIAGEGPERAALEARIQALGLRDVVAMPGFVNPITPLFSQIDVLAMSSHSEGMPMTLLEAVAAGVRIVATRVGGIPEVLESYSRAALIEPGGVPALAEALSAALSNRDGGPPVDLGAFRQRFASTTMERSYRDVYREVIC